MSSEPKKVIGKCALCGGYEKIRPYGPNKKEICCKCESLEQTYQSLKGRFTDLFLKYLEEVVDEENNE